MWFFNQKWSLWGAYVKQTQFTRIKLLRKRWALCIGNTQLLRKISFYALSVKNYLQMCKFSLLYGNCGQARVFLKRKVNSFLVLPDAQSVTISQYDAGICWAYCSPMVLGNGTRKTYFSWDVLNKQEYFPLCLCEMRVICQLNSSHLLCAKWVDTQWFYLGWSHWIWGKCICLHRMRLISFHQR